MIRVKDIKWRKPTRFTGKNGISECKGIEFYSGSQDRDLIINPITSKYMLGDCEIIIPKDKIKELIEVLKEFEEFYEQRHY